MKHFLQKMWLMALMLLVSVGAAWAQKTYTKVTDASTLKAGDVIILACDDKGTYAGAMGENSYFASVEAKEKAIEITLGGSASGWTLTTSEGVIGTSSAKKLLKDQGTNTWEITISDGNAFIVSTTSTYGTIYFNASSPRFLNYTSAQTKIQIYKVTGNASTTPSEPTWSTTPTSVSVAAGKTASLSYNTNYNGQLYIGSMDEEVATVTTNGKTVTVTGVKEGETTIYFSGNATSSMKALYQTVPVVVTAASDGGNTEVTGGTYTLTDLANLSATDEVLVVWTPQAGGAYALSNDKGTTAAPTAVSVAINNKSITTDAENIVWNVDYNSTDKTFTLYPAGTTDEWLYATNTNNGVRVGTNTNKTFNIKNDYLFHIGTSRYLGVYNNADIRCYTSSGGNIANQTVAFYVKTANGGGDTGGGDTGGGGDTPDFTGFIKNANIDVALNGEQYDISADLNIPKGYDKDPYAIRTTIDGQSQKDGEFACAYPWITFLKVGTYTVHVACVNGSQVLAEGNITVKVYDPNGEVVDPEQPEQNVFASLAELVAAGAPTSTAKTVTVTLTDEEIIGIYKTTTKDGKEYRNGIFFKSGEQQVMLYSHDVPTEWVKGGHVSGTLTNCPWKLYNTNWELCPADWSELTYVAPPVKECTSLTIAGEPTAKEFYTGESFDVAGLTATAHYSDGSTTDVTKNVEWTCTPKVFTTEGNVSVKVTATYEEKTSEEMTYTVTVTKNPYVIAQNFTETSGNIDENISYEAFKGNAANDPISPKDSGYIRLYQNGGYITINGAKGVTISEVILTTGSTYASTTIGTAIDDAEAPTEGTEVAKNSDFKASGLNCNSISFYCLGTDKDHRIDVATIKVKYTKKDISLTEIAISGEGVGKEFIQYAEFDHEGVAVTAKYSDGSSTDVTDKTEFTAPDMTTTGEKTVAVSYTEGGVTKTSSYTINVVSETVKAIHIAATGKTLFRLGESFSSEGLSVTADYNSGRKGIELETDQYTVVAPEMETLGKKEVTVALVADEEITVSYAVNIVPANTIFYESFDTNDGTGGNDGQWKGSIASNNIKSDNTWIFTSASGANQCAKFGAGSTAGSAVTPALGHEGSVTVSFKAAAWDGSYEKTNITVSIDGDDTSVQTIELTKGEWNDYTVTLNGLTAESKVKFAASQSSNNRFFLDEVLISEATEPDATVCVVTNYIEALKKGEAGYTLDGLEAIINGILMKK